MKILVLVAVQMPHGPLPGMIRTQDPPKTAAAFRGGGLQTVMSSPGNGHVGHLDRHKKKYFHCLRTGPWRI